MGETGLAVCPGGYPAAPSCICDRCGAQGGHKLDLAWGDRAPAIGICQDHLCIFYGGDAVENHKDGSSGTKRKV